MRPLTDDTPKPLLELHGKALIEYHLEALAGSGVESVVINISWLGERIRQHLGNGARYGLEIRYSEEPEALETAGGIVKAMPMLEDRFIVVNADVFTDFDFRLLSDIDSDAHLVLVPNPEQHPLGDFALQGNRLRNEGEVKFTFSGIAKYRKTFFDGINPGRQALAPLLREAANQDRVSTNLFCGEWYDIGTVERLQQLRRKPLNPD